MGQSARGTRRFGGQPCTTPSSTTCFAAKTTSSGASWAPCGPPSRPPLDPMAASASQTLSAATTRTRRFWPSPAAAQALFSGRRPVTTLDADVESNPENYTAAGQLKFVKDLLPTRLAVFEGMAIYTTLNVDKARDFVNGMKAFVESYDRGPARSSQSLSQGIAWPSGRGRRQAWAPTPSTPSRLATATPFSR